MRRAALFAVFAVSSARAARASEIVVVAPESPMPPYQEALQGVCDALGACPPVLSPGASLPRDAKVVIALGARAARRSYPAGEVLVTALTPGFAARLHAAAGSVVRVQMDYTPEEFARRLRQLKPDSHRAVVLWSQESSRRYAEAVRAAAAPLDLEVLPVQVARPDEVPSLLRSLPDSDALWLAPDPDLVTLTTFDAAREYALSRGITFFAPAPGLAGRGADPGLTPAFRDSGLRAGEAAREILSGRVPPEMTYPDGSASDPKPQMVSTATSTANPH